MHELSQRATEVLAKAGDGPAIEYQDRWYSWTEVRALADGLAALIAASKADPQGAVVFIARSTASAIATFLALIREGRTIRMIYPFQSGAGIARDIAHFKPAIVVGSEQDFGVETLAAIKAQGAAAISIDDMAAKVLADFERSTAARDSDLRAEPQIGILTSGTTGKPKPFAISYDMLAKYFVGGGSAIFGARKAEQPPALLYYPPGNISGLFSILPALLNGQRMIVLDRFDLKGWRDYVVRYRPVSSGTPAAGVQMILDANIPQEDLTSLRFFGTGAAPLDPGVQRAFEERYSIPILLSYGATEFGGPVTAMTPDLYAAFGHQKFGSVGKPIGGAQVRIVDPATGAEVPLEQEGLIEVISPKIGTHWIRTSDIGVIDSDGFLFHRGRADGAIVRGGFKILPETIEQALLKHHAISVAAVVGIADRRLGQVPAAAIQMKPGKAPLSDADLEAHLRLHVLATHIPTRWIVVDELPKTVSTKIDRPAIKRLFEKSQPD